MGQQPYTVIGYIIGTDYHIFCKQTWSVNPETAMEEVGNSVLENDDEDFIICAVLAGHHENLKPDY